MGGRYIDYGWGTKDTKSKQNNQRLKNFSVGVEPRSQKKIQENARSKSYLNVKRPHNEDDSIITDSKFSNNDGYSNKESMFSSKSPSRARKFG